MDTIEKYINSGILELYVMGAATDEESLEVKILSEANIRIKNEIDAIVEALKGYSAAMAPEIDPSVKPMIMATIDYSERIKNGEEIVVAPLLHKLSKIEDYKTWIDRPDMQNFNASDEIDAKIISANPEATTLIIWLKNGAPIEVHDKEYEHFLILEGTCNITIGEEIHSLSPGSYLSIPLFIGHSVKVTSSFPCKILLQRVAA